MVTRCCLRNLIPTGGILTQPGRSMIYSDIELAQQRIGRTVTRVISCSRITVKYRLRSFLLTLSTRSRLRLLPLRSSLSCDSAER